MVLYVDYLIYSQNNPQAYILIPISDEETEAPRAYDLLEVAQLGDKARTETQYV